MYFAGARGQAGQGASDRNSGAVDKRAKGGERKSRMEGTRQNGLMKGLQDMAEGMGESKLERGGGG